MRNPKLQPWLEAGIKRFALNGINGLNISEIAKETNTASSSFYHYFNTKEEYLEDLLDFWHEEGSMKIVKEVFLEDEPKKAIQRLFKLIFESNFIYECFLIQLRAASFENKTFLKKVIETDKIRISFLTSLLARTGLTEDQARTRAIQIHNYVTGLHVSLNLVEPDKKIKQRFYEDLEMMFAISVND